MQRDPERRPFLDVSILWEDSLSVVFDEVEVGDLLMYGEWRWEYPTVVRVLSVNEDKTLTVMEIYSCEVWCAKPSELARVDFHRVPPHEESPPDLNWRGYGDRPLCADEHNCYDYDW